MRELKRTAGLQAGILFGCVLVAWLIELVDELFYGGALDRFGIQPRNVNALSGILAAPLLHGSWLHLTANSGPFLVLGWLVMLRRIVDFVLVSVVAILIGGLGVWVIGSPSSIHIGASGLVFGYLGYLLARGYFERSFWSMALALVAGLLYGGVLFSVLPGQRGISWEGHLFGLIGGIVAARLLTRPKPSL
jgi:membrane associated rhomboid family serine protease